jgi:hypothetical protein
MSKGDRMDKVNGDVGEREPGYYWAKLQSWRDASPKWQPVELVSGPGLLVTGDDVDYGIGDVVEWGPRLEPRHAG